MLFAFLFCCKRGLNHWVDGPGWQHPKEEQGCTDTHPAVTYMGVGTRGFYPTPAVPHARQKGWFAPWGAIPWGLMGGGVEAVVRVRVPLGGRQMQMAVGLSGCCWSPLVCRHAAHSGHARERWDYQRVSCLQQVMRLSSRQHICFFCLGGRAGKSGVENNHMVIVHLMRACY